MHPVLTTDEAGKLKAASVLFGANNLHNKLTMFVLKQIKDDSQYKFSVAHSNAEDQGNEIIEFIQDNFKNIYNIDLVDMGSALGVHAGPGAFAIGIQKIVDE